MQKTSVNTEGEILMHNILATENYPETNLKISKLISLRGCSNNEIIRPIGNI